MSERSSLPRRVDDTLWEIPASARPDMRVPARVFADPELLEAISTDHSLEQLQNVATLPGIVEAAFAMPDIHQGYGFPVGGLAATDTPDGVVSPGGVGYDINCGVRLLAAPFSAQELGARREPLDLDEVVAGPRRPDLVGTPGTRALGDRARIGPVDAALGLRECDVVLGPDAAPLHQGGRAMR